MKLDRTMQRDPRAAPELAPKNISAPETCEFYGARDSISHCRFPRSCHDCLAKPECSWSGYGKCVDTASAWGDDDDYRKLLRDEYWNQSYPYFNDMWVAFPANHTHYCAATDPVCKSCQDKFQDLSKNRDVGNQFCVGENGCVCIASCELPQHVRLDYMPWSEPYCEPVRPVAATKKKKLMGFTSTKRDPRAPTVDILNQPKEETCAYYGTADVQGNGAPRTCRDCLQREGCVIAGDTCVDMTKYDPGLDFRELPRYEGDNYNYSQDAMFPSVNTTYCEVLDPRCTSVYDGWESYRSSQFFIGEGGCVCIQACERSLWAANAPRQYTRIDSSYPGQSSGSDEGTIRYVVGFAVFFALVYHRYAQASADADVSARRQNRARRQLLLRHMVDQAPSLPRQLSLSGWRGYRENLVHKEHRFLQGPDTARSPSLSSSSPTGSTVDYVDAASPTQNAATTPRESDVPMRRSSSSRSSTM